ncbi:MAG: hypothetical protein R2809_12745 [Flavobacteriales bacterium]
MEFISLITYIPYIIVNENIQRELLYTTTSYIIIIPLLLILIAFAPKIVALLKLDSGIGSFNIELKQLNNDIVAKFCIFIIGFLIMFNTFTDLLKNTYDFITVRLDNNTFDPNPIQSYDLIFQLVQFGLGYLIIVQHERIIKLLFSQENPEEQKSVDA